MERILVGEFGTSAVLQHREGAEPVPAPGAGEVVVAMSAAGINPAETYIRSGTYEFLRPDLPYTPGFDGAGTVLAAGSAAGGLKPGDRVWVCLLPGRKQGTYAGLLVCDHTLVHRLPDGYSFEEGAAIGVPYLTAHRALFARGRAASGETVLVQGASGGVGSAVVQLARAAGLTVIGTASTPEGREAVLASGADHAMGHAGPEHLDEIKRLTGGRGADLVVEMRADLNLDTDIGLLAPRGRIVIVGARGRSDIAPRQLMGVDGDIMGVLLWNMDAAEFAESVAAIGSALEAGTIRPVVGPRFPLRDVAEAHDQVIAGGASGRVVLTIEPARA